MSERCEQTSKHMSERPSTCVWILAYSGPQQDGGYAVIGGYVGVGAIGYYHAMAHCLDNDIDGEKECIAGA